MTTNNSWFWEICFFFSSRRRHTRCSRDWSSDVCSSDLYGGPWSWAGVDRLAVRGFLAAEQRRGLAKRSVARALSALRTFYRFLNATRGLEVKIGRASCRERVEISVVAVSLKKKKAGISGRA